MANGTKVPSLPRVNTEANVPNPGSSGVPAPGRTGGGTYQSSGSAFLTAAQFKASGGWKATS